MSYSVEIEKSLLKRIDAIGRKIVPVPDDSRKTILFLLETIVDAIEARSLVEVYTELEAYGKKIRGADGRTYTVFQAGGKPDLGDGKKRDLRKMKLEKHL